MSPIYEALPIPKVTISGGTGEYELKKSEAVAALCKEVPYLKEGRGWPV
jgi:hypothetical protein